MGENCHDLYQCVLELETSERTYHEQLNYLSDLYILHLKTCVTLGEEMEQMLLTKMRDVSELSRKLAVKLRERLTVWDEDCSLISDVFLKDPDFWDLYGYFCLNIDSAIRKYDEKLECPDFAALVSLKQGLDNPSLRELILLPVERLKKYKEFFDLFLEKTVSADFIFSHPDFSAVMECKKKVEEMIPPRLSEIMQRKQVEEFNRIESLLGSLSLEFFSYIRLLHEEPATAKPWRKRAVKKSFSRGKGDGARGAAPERLDIGGRNYAMGDVAPDILNAVKKQEEIDILSGMSSPKQKTSRASPGEHFVASVSKVKVRWENEVHTYNLHLFRQCLVFSKIRNKSMKISRIVKLKQLWLSEYKDIIGFGSVEKEENAFLGSWLGSELDSELLHRVIFSFPNKDTRVHWYILLQRNIQWATQKAGSGPGMIKVYFKKSDSRISVPCDTLWQGMSCQELQVDPTRTVRHVIEEAVNICKMKDNAYTLSFMILQDTKIVYEEQLIWMEIPLIIQSEVKAMVPDPRSTQMIFVLQENGSNGGSSSGTSSPTPSNKLNTVVTFFRGRPNTGTGYRPSPASQLLTPAVRSANTMFGVPLSEFMGDDPDTVPPLLLDLMIYIFNHCYNCEGIFRVPGSLAVQRALEKRLEAGERVNWCLEELQDKFYLPNVASSLFKYYLRSVPGGLIPRKLFPELEEWRAGVEKGSEARRAGSVGSMKEILSRVPRPNLTLLRYTLHILKRITDFSTVNLMDVTVLSTCIGPSFVTWPEDANALSILADQYRRQTPSAITEFLVEHVQEMAGTPPRALERRKVVEEEVRSRASRVDEVESSDEDTNSVWILMRSSIKEYLPGDKEEDSDNVAPVRSSIKEYLLGDTEEDSDNVATVEEAATSTAGIEPDQQPGTEPDQQPGTLV